jgi:predicted transcriptional regulator
MYLKSFNMPRSMRGIAAAVAVCAFALPAVAAPIKDLPSNKTMRTAIVSVTSKKLMDAPGGKFNGDKPVTRYELAVALDRLVRYIENGRKPLHPTLRPKAAKLPAGAPADVRTALQNLTEYNFIGSDSILLKGKGTEPVTANQLASLMSQVTIRLSDRAVPPQED